MTRRSAAWTAFTLVIGLAGPDFWGLAFAGGRPDDASAEIVQRAPYRPGSVQKTVEFWEGRTRKAPGRYLEFRELAGAYLARQRETGDIEDAVRAERAARRSLELLNRGNLVALTRLVRSLLGQHRFPEALEASGRAAAIDPKAWLLVADIEMELGHTDKARSAFAQAPADPEDLSALVLRARFADADGDPGRALHLLREAARRADEFSDLPAETAAWFHVMVGHTLIDRGRLDEGTTACRTALAIFPRDYRAMTGLAEAAAFRCEWDQVIVWASRAIEASPQNPEALKLLVEAYAASGDRKEAERQHRRFEQLAHSFPRIYDRHWALYCADHDQNLDEVYALATRDLELRTDAAAYETLAWVTFKKGLQSEAESAIRSALARKPQTASFFHHAAIITQAAGDLRGAESFLGRARDLNPYLVKMTNPAKPRSATN
jgi:tetratricopeptide (TPR) repeat protein